MKFSISLPTGFEGVMYPVPFVDPSDFVRMAKLAEKLGYHSVWGNDHIQSMFHRPQSRGTTAMGKINTCSTGIGTWCTSRITTKVNSSGSTSVGTKMPAR